MKTKPIGQYYLTSTMFHTLISEKKYHYMTQATQYDSKSAFWEFDIILLEKSQATALCYTKGA
jgi:hypothetical protein